MFSHGHSYWPGAPPNPPGLFFPQPRQMESAAEGHHFGGALLDATYGSKRRLDIIKEISDQQRVAVTSVNVWLICNLPEWTNESLPSTTTAEQWIKEGKGAIKWTRLSCRTFAANAVRLQLHALAYNLGNFLRTLATPEPIKDWSLSSLKEKLIKIGAAGNGGGYASGCERDLIEAGLNEAAWLWLWGKRCGQRCDGGVSAAR